MNIDGNIVVETRSLQYPYPYGYGSVTHCDPSKRCWRNVHEGHHNGIPFASLLQKTNDTDVEVIAVSQIVFDVVHWTSCSVTNHEESAVREAFEGE